MGKPALETSSATCCARLRGCLTDQDSLLPSGICWIRSTPSSGGCSAADVRLLIVLRGRFVTTEDTEERHYFTIPDSYTIRPPTTVRTTFASLSCVTGIEKRSRSIITKSASLPDVSEPLLASSPSAHALFTV